MMVEDLANHVGCCISVMLAPFNVTMPYFVIVQIPLFAREQVVVKEEPGNDGTLNNVSPCRVAHNGRLANVFSDRLLYRSHL